MKTKQISKHSNPTGPSNTKPKKTSKAPKKVTNQQGDPLIKNLSDFVTSIKIDYSNKPFYTGGRLLATQKNIYATCNQQICVYGIQQGKVIDKFKQANDEIVNFAICPQEKYIVTFTQNSIMRVIKLETKQVIHTIRLPGLFANDLAFSPDGQYLAIAFGNQVHIYKFETMKRTPNNYPKNTQFAIKKVQWHPGKSKYQIITCDTQSKITVFDCILNSVVTVINNAGTQFCLAQNSENMYVLIAVNNSENQINVYEYECKTKQNSNKIAVIKSEQYIQYVHAVGQQVFVGGQESQLHSFNLDSFKLRAHESFCTDNGIGKITSIGKNKNRKLLVLSTQQNITVLKVTGSALKFEGLIVGYNDQIIDIKHSKTQPENSKHFVMITNSNNFKMVNKSTHRVDYLIKGHTNTVLCVDYFHPYIVSAGKDNVVKLWRIRQEGDMENENEINGNGVELIANYSGHSGDVLSLVAMTKSKIIATVSEDLTIKLWTMCTDTQQKVQIKSAIRTAIAHQKSINSIRSSPNEELLATCSQDRTIKLWNQSLTNIMTLAGHKRGVWDTAFHPVQQMLVSAGGDGMLKGWNILTGECIWSMGQGAALIRCSWLYYNQIVTGSQSGIVKIWDIRKQTSLSYDKHEGKIWALDVVKNEDKIEVITGGTDSVYHIWSDNTKQMKQNIMHENELEEQQRIFYNQHMMDKNYCEAAIVAFKSNYVKLFMNVLAKMGCKIDVEQSVQVNSQGALVLNESENIGIVTDEQFNTMALTLKQIDLNRLLLTIQSMISTVKMYKVANRLLLCILKSSSFSQLAELNSSFALPETSEDLNQFNEKKSGLIKWLQSMIGYEQKHQTRIGKYLIGTHWIQHLHRVENPFSAF